MAQTNKSSDLVHRAPAVTSTIQTAVEQHTNVLSIKPTRITLDHVGGLLTKLNACDFNRYECHIEGVFGQSEKLYQTFFAWSSLKNL